MNSLGKREGRHKRIQAVSPLFFWKRKKRHTWQREKRMKKMNNTLLFSRFRKPENFRKLLVKEEEEEIQEDA